MVRYFNSTLHITVFSHVTPYRAVIRQLATESHGVTSQKTATFTATSWKVSNITSATISLLLSVWGSLVCTSVGPQSIGLQVYTWCAQVLRSPKEAFAAAMQSWRERCEKRVCLEGDYVEK